MKTSLETALCTYLTRARAFGHSQAEWLATRVLASKSMNEGQICAALVRLEAMLANPTVAPVRANRTDIIHMQAIVTQGDYK